jgi:hypothetical protein
VDACDCARTYHQETRGSSWFASGVFWQYQLKQEALMKKTRFGETQIVVILKEADAG